MPQSGDTVDVLVVEDDQTIGELIEMALSNEGYRIKVASNAETALTLVRAIRPRLILLDMNMPGVTGWDFAHEYRKLPGLHAPIVVMTAAGWAKERAAQIGAVAALGKPFDIDDLLTLVRKYVDDRPQLRVVT
ncbi:MAG TPA: response regulator [Dehalococcoidia bacterium]|nr:response regulator [Dehalococcoidia bacterium]